MLENPVTFMNRVYGELKYKTLIRQAEALIQIAAENKGNIGLNHIESLAAEENWDEMDLLRTIGILAYHGYFKYRLTRMVDGIEVSVPNSEFGELVRAKDSTALKNVSIFYEATWLRPDKQSPTPSN